MDKPGVRAVLLLAFVVVLFLRMPNVLHGRLWAEEGVVFFEHAASMPALQALLLPYAGYINLVANAAPVVALHLVPLEQVPWIVTGIGLLFQCFPALVLLCSQDAWLRPPAVRIAALLLVAAAPQVEEVWLQSLHSQFHLALCCALILALDIPRRRLALFGAAVLLLAPLCGPAAWVLPPLFVARAIIDRSWQRLAQAAAIGAGVGLQVLFFYEHTAGRSYGIGPIVLLCVVYIKQIIIPLFGVRVAAHEVAGLQARIAARLFPWRAVVVSLSLFAVFAAALLRGRQAAAIWLFLAGCATGWIAYFGAIGGGISLLQIGGGGRYVFLPEVLASLSLLALAAGTTRPERWPIRCVVGWLIIIGLADLRSPHAFIKQGPDWRREVALWRRDHSHPIALWPVGWFMTLKSE